MKQEELGTFARQAAKHIKTEGDLNDIRQIFTKVTVEAALKAELEDHLGYEKTRNRTIPTTAMAPHPKPSAPKTVHLN